MSSVRSGSRLRAWQQEALDGYLGTLPADYLATATPGAGKTTFAAVVAKELIARRRVDRVVVIAPTDHLRTQWAEAANRHDLTLDPSLSNAVGPVATDFQGYVSTYAQVAAAPRLHQARIEAKRTLVILDEVHHAGDAKSWGDAVVEACTGARYRLCLSGTPYRTDQAKIPFVRYEPETSGGQRSVADYTYGYREALRDGVVRPVMFAAYSGVSRWRNRAGEVLAASLSDELSKEDEAAAWRTALNPAGQWIPHVFVAADDRLSQVRAAGMSDAGGMVLAPDMEHARAYARVMARITGRDPVVVLSDDSAASARIDAFAVSDDRWLVAVRQVSEGVDIPRLSVGVFATNSRTPLFFAQAVGRFVRARRPGETATVFLPAVRPLLVLAAELETERDHVLKPPEDTDDGLLDPVPDEQQDEPDDPTLGFEALDAQAAFAHVLMGGAAHTGDTLIDPDGPDQDFLGLPGLLSAEQTAALLKSREVQARAAGRAASGGDEGLTPSQVQSAHHQAAGLRREVNKLVGQVAGRRQQPHAQVHSALKKAVPGPPSASATVTVLERRRDHLLGMLL